MKVISKIADLRAELDQVTGKIGFVPTMGALHKGHMSLVERCRCECDVVVVSLFVNPTQFNDLNDLKNYPRTPEADAEMLHERGADLIFTPEVTEMYPEKDTRLFEFGTLESVMEGALRPGHFNGVAQIVSKFFDVVKPDKAYFGEKDFQQLAIIRQLVKQLGDKVEIVGCPIIRAEDGLALSSRNALLSPNGRKIAPYIYKVLKDASARCSKMSPDELEKWVIEELEKHPEFDVDYFNIVDALTMSKVTSWSESDTIQGCTAVRVENGIRLIDNIRLK